MGHASGVNMLDIGQDVVCPFLSNAFHCNRFLGHMLVLLQLHDLTVVFAAPYYTGVRQVAEKLPLLQHHTAAS